MAIWFCVKKKGVSGCKIQHEAARDYAKVDEKLSFVSNKPLRERQFDLINPDAKNNWINLANNDFDSLLPLVNRDTKSAKTQANERALFRTFSMGVTTNRDEWLYDKSKQALGGKVTWFLSVYKKELLRVGGHSMNPDKLDRSIKWTRTLLRSLEKRVGYEFDTDLIRPCLYRPFVKVHLYFTAGLNEYMYDLPAIFPTNDVDNQSINISVAKDFTALASGQLIDLHFVGDSMLVPFKRFDIEGREADNITDWGLKQFQQHYKEITKGADKAKWITKQAIFYYCYAVLHDSLYREKYALNLKREFPRIPFYAGFRQWVAWGETLMTLHIGYESIDPFELQRIDTPDEKARAAGLSPKTLLRADKNAGIITLDTETMLRGIPADAWNYRLGNRCALEWVLDQYKEKKHKDPTIREKFDTYRFADYKEKVIDLLARVTTVSVETVRITQAMKQAVR